MSSRRNRRSGRFPLHLTIATVFSILFLIVGLALISYHYLESRRMAILGANRSMARTSLYLERTISDLYGPVRNLVDMASRVLPPIAAGLYKSVGRSPLAGLAAVFAGVAAGFSANLLLTALDPLLAGFTTEGANLLDEGYTVAATSRACRDAILMLAS